MTNLSLYTICFLDALSVGFLLPILAYHIFSIGGTHTVLGVLGTCHATFQLISGPLIRSWRDVLGKKTALLFIMFINFATYIPLGLTTSYAVVVLLRLICALTNQTQTICKAFVAELNAREKHDGVYSVMSAVTVAGLVVGPIIGGAMYELENGFYHISILSALVLALCLMICFTLPRLTETENTSDSTSFVQKINEDLHKSFYNFQNISWNKQWNVVLSKYLYNTSTSVFFIKFSMLLKLHYNARPTVVGYTYAYQSILTFLSLFGAAFLKQKFSKISADLTSSLFIVTIGFMGLCYAPTYDIYLVSFIPMVLAHTLLSNSWKQLFALHSTKEHNIEGVEDTITTTASIVTPVVFGVFCDLYGHHALKAFVILPLIFDILVAVVFSTKAVAPAPVVSEKEVAPAPVVSENEVAPAPVVSKKED